MPLMKDSALGIDLKTVVPETRCDFCFHFLSLMKKRGMSASRLMTEPEWVFERARSLGRGLVVFAVDEGAEVRLTATFLCQR